jgi:hypothetical protein
MHRFRYLFLVLALASAALSQFLVPHGLGSKFCALGFFLLAIITLLAFIDGPRGVLLDDSVPDEY